MEELFNINLKKHLFSKEDKTHRDKNQTIFKSGLNKKMKTEFSI